MPENYEQSAIRHYEAASSLKGDEQHQEAAYLGGYVAECAFKALLTQTGTAMSLRRLNHDLTGISGEALELALVLSPGLRRYQVRPEDAFRQWKPEHRYEPNGFLSDSELDEVYRATTESGVSLLVAMALDGHLGDS